MSDTTSDNGGILSEARIVAQYWYTGFKSGAESVLIATAVFVTIVVVGFWPIPVSIAIIDYYSVTEPLKSAIIPVALVGWWILGLWPIFLGAEKAQR